MSKRLVPALGGAGVGRGRLPDTAPGQAALLFALAGTLGLITEGLLDAAGPRTIGIAINACAVLAAVVIDRVPWQRWSDRASLVLVPVAFALLMLGQRFAPGSPTVYGVWYVVVFAWIGFWHTPRTPLAFGPLGAIAYVVPFVGVASTPPDAIASAVVAVPAAVILGEVVAAQMDKIHRTHRELTEARTLLERANLTDDLTGVGNRRRANALLDSIQPGDGLVLLDLDNFKRVNDTLGHAEGDRILSRLGAYLRESVRDVDTIARFGGEEFLVLLRGSGPQVGLIAQRLIEGWHAQDAGVTLTGGVAVHTTSRHADATFRAADAALYEGKRLGRNRVVAEPPVLPASRAVDISVA